MKRNIGIILGLIFMLLALTACASGTSPATPPLPNPPMEESTFDITDTSIEDTSTEATSTEVIPPLEDASTPLATDNLTRPNVDREGFAITLPDEINTIISIGPSNTEILVALGFGDKIISADGFSDNVEGIAEGISVLDMLSLDAEFIIDLNPDIIFITGMTRVHGDDDPLRLVSDVGITVIYMPASTSIAAIVDDVRFIAAVMDAHDAGESIISDMQAEIDAIREIAATITETKTVYFEIAPAPNMWTLGADTFINEMIEIVGAVNIFADKYSWVSVADEVLLEANPDVIMTSVDFLDDPIEEIMNRPGWDTITAVRSGDVFQINTDYSNRPSHNIVKALREIAAAVHPDYFQ